MRRPSSWLNMFLPDPGRTEQNTGWFPARVTAVLASGYRFEEMEIAPDGSTRVKRGGRVNTARDPAYALFDGEFGEGDGALCRWAPGAGNRAWELVDLDKRMSGSGAGAIAGCDLETVSFDVVTAVACDDSGGLTVTTRRISITGCNLSVSSADAPPVIGSCDGAGEALAGYPNLTLTGVAGGPLTLEYSGGQYRVDTNGDPDGWRLAYSGGAWTLTEVQDGVYVRSGAATAGACSPFSLTFAGSDFGLSGSITVGL